MSPSNPSTELLAPASLVSPSEGHWVSLHRDLTSPEEKQLTDYIGIVDSQSNHSIHTEELISGGMSPQSKNEDLARTESTNQPSMHSLTDGYAEAKGGDELHDPDSLEDIDQNITESVSTFQQPTQTTFRNEGTENANIVPNELKLYPAEKNVTLAFESEQLKVWYQKIWVPDSLKVALKVESLGEKMTAGDLQIKHCRESEDESFPVEASISFTCYRSNRFVVSCLKEVHVVQPLQTREI